MNNLEALKRMSDNLNKNLPAVDNAKIKNPAREIEGTIADFLVGRFSKVTEDANFERAIKDNILSRLDEANFSELSELLHNVSMDNNDAMNSLLTAFKSDQDGKNIIETLREGDKEGAAVEVYNSIEDKNVLQALNYLNQIMTQLSGSNQ